MPEPLTVGIFGVTWAASYFAGPPTSKYIKEKLEVPENSNKAKAIDLLSDVGTGVAAAAVLGAALIPAGIYAFGVGTEGIRKGSMFAAAQAKGYILTPGCFLSRIQSLGMSPPGVSYMMGAIGGGLAGARKMITSRL